MYWNTFFVALALLTRFPMSHNLLAKAYEKDTSSSVIFYPVVGGLIGLLLCILVLLLPENFPNILTSCLILTVWVGITGALHLDGVADSVDAYFASHKSPEKTLDVFQDPHVGAMAVVSVCLMLMLKASLIATVLTLNKYALLILFFSPMLSRFMVVLYMQYTPYVREDGIASALNLSEFRFITALMGLMLLILVIICFPFAATFWMIVVSTFFVWGWRRLWINKIGGYTGDCAGAFIEIFEVLFLLVLVWILLW